MANGDLLVISDRFDEASGDGEIVGVGGGMNKFLRLERSRRGLVPSELGSTSGEMVPVNQQWCSEWRKGVQR